MLYRLTHLESRAASAENPTAGRGMGGQAAGGLKGAPALKDFQAGETAVLLDIDGPGMVRHIWMTTKPRAPIHLRNLIIRMYWEGHDTPSVEAPLGDFFGVCHGASVPFQSHLFNLQEARGHNCWVPMPFARHARITLTNESDTDFDFVFYQVDFTLGDEVTEDDGRFHSAFRREMPCPYGHDFTLMQTRGARGMYLGCAFGILPLELGWWGEGEVKMYIDGDDLFPTICGTGTEDYVGSAWGLNEHSTPYQGAPLMRHWASMYRLHVPDPVYFQEDIKVTVQQMGAGYYEDAKAKFGEKLIFNPKNHPRRRPDDGYYLRSDDWCSCAWWYQWPLITDREPMPDKELRSAHVFREIEPPQAQDAPL